ncbi:2-hydroxy-3-oxopropionate reductase [Roseococcus sp.]|uniref:2-hydroxy-3-oxopropionate reductase n=1 Tax=Roseococcus sp. TaxID=2109646 RepID=UPI003BA9F6D1
MAPRARRSRGWAGSRSTARKSSKETQHMKIGFVGLGIMGLPMAQNLAKGGHEIIVPERKSLSAESRAAFQVAADATAVAQAAEIIILMVPDTPDVERALFGAGGVAAGLSKGKLVIDMSSISPTATKDFAAKINALGCDYIDAPVSGGEVGAKNAALTIMIGAPQAAFDRALPLFQLMGKNITLVGENGAGQVTKVANQIIVALNIEAVSEALVFASKAGADPAKVRAALMGGFANSRILEVHAERMINRTFNPGFRIELHQKDLNLALQSAKELGVALPNTASTQQLFSACAAMGGGGWDHSGLVQALEKMADHKIG